MYSLVRGNLVLEVAASLVYHGGGCAWLVKDRAAQQGTFWIGESPVMQRISIQGEPCGNEGGCRIVNDFVVPW